MVEDTIGLPLSGGLAEAITCTQQVGADCHQEPSGGAGTTRRMTHACEIAAPNAAT